MPADKRKFFMKSERLGFSKWRKDDIELAKLLWGEPEVTHYICAAGVFTEEEIAARLRTEIKQDEEYGVQYWAVFLSVSIEQEQFIGCAGLRPYGSKQGVYEIGFHLRKEYWVNGYAYEAARAVIQYTFSVLNAKKLHAGHHPDNEASKRLLEKLGFMYIRDEFYEPTGLYHPSYVMQRKVVIRKYRPADCRTLAELFYNTVHAVNVKDYTEEQLNVWADKHVDLNEWNRSFTEHYTIVACDNDEIIGFGDITADGYLDRLYVHKDYQNAGAATAICNELESSCDVPVITTHASITARPFFEKRGYRVVKEQQVERKGILLKNYVMEKIKNKEILK